MSRWIHWTRLRNVRRLSSSNVHWHPSTLDDSQYSFDVLGPHGQWTIPSSNLLWLVHQRIKCRNCLQIQKIRLARWSFFAISSRLHHWNSLGLLFWFYKMPFFVLFSLIFKPQKRLLLFSCLLPLLSSRCSKVTMDTAKASSSNIKSVQQHIFPCFPPFLADSLKQFHAH